MKNNILKFLFLTTLVLLVGCENEDDSRFQENTAIGYVELPTASSTTGARATSTTVYVNVATPIYDTFSVDYTLTAVTGDFTQYVSINSGTVSIIPDNATKIYAIEIPLQNMDALRDSETVFDLELTAVNGNPTVQLGLPGADDKQLVQTVTIPCNEPSVLDELAPAYPNFLTGDFYLADEENAGLIPYFGSAVPATPTDPAYLGQPITISVGNTPNERVFSAVFYPGTRFASLVTVTLEIIEDENVGRVVILKNAIAPFTLGCNGRDGLDLTPYTIDVDDADQEDLDYTTWEICEGGPDVYVINAVETTGGCAAVAELFSTFSITKR